MEKSKAKSQPSKCNSCLCDFFKEAKPGQRFTPILRGQSTPAPIILTFIKYDPMTCCVTFSFDEEGSTLIAYGDCNKIAGIIPLS
ncbi:hypothetical protein FIU87_07350 [Bacillus sp. THAF10]|uniref:hypothetical protein n=1 Tax=Bacillus sp. THAF10 TaxID=2587848 RepID=UPI0012689F35|nr:hypothetical protein [Bacillus sp. THAF10]QFT88454.1 hypothetical protein FIU87_07350 [Bacillus sp. THAF10]